VTNQPPFAILQVGRSGVTFQNWVVVTILMMSVDEAGSRHILEGQSGGIVGLSGQEKANIMLKEQKPQVTIGYVPSGIKFCRDPNACNGSPSCGCKLCKRNRWIDKWMESEEIKKKVEEEGVLPMSDESVVETLYRIKPVKQSRQSFIQEFEEREELKRQRAANKKDEIERLNKIITMQESTIKDLMEDKQRLIRDLDEAKANNKSMGDGFEKVLEGLRDANLLTHSLV